MCGHTLLCNIRVMWPRHGASSPVVLLAPRFSGLNCSAVCNHDVNWSSSGLCCHDNVTCYHGNRQYKYYLSNNSLIAEVILTQIVCVDEARGQNMPEYLKVGVVKFYHHSNRQTRTAPFFVVNMNNLWTLVGYTVYPVSERECDVWGCVMCGVWHTRIYWLMVAHVKKVANLSHTQTQSHQSSKHPHCCCNVVLWGPQVPTHVTHSHRAVWGWRQGSVWVCCESTHHILHGAHQWRTHTGMIIALSIAKICQFIDHLEK